MSAKGARYKWKEGCILHAARYWKSPTMRRLPRILIEDRALEVGILAYIEDIWTVFKETPMEASTLQSKNALPLQFYQNRYHLLPESIEGIDTYTWMKESPHALLIWGVGRHYFALPAKR